MATRLWFAVLVDPRGIFFRKDAEVADQLVRGLEAVDADHLGRQDRGGAGADTGNGVNLIGLGQALMNLDQEIAKVVFLLAAAAELTDQPAAQFLSNGTTAATDRTARCGLEFLGFVGGQIGNGCEGVMARPR